MAPTRRSSRRSGGPVDYSEAVLDFEADDEEALEADEVARAAKKKLAARELAKERAARVKRDEDDADFGKLTYKEKKKKKQEKAKRVANKDAGKLSSIFALPMDLLAVIFSELEPLNLLHLSRANKQLNTFLSSRDASPIWAACRKNLVLYVPKVPGDSPFNYDTWEEINGALEPLHMPVRPACLTDAAYTRLLFESFCSTCGGPYAGSEYWSQGMKFCHTCPSGMKNRETAIAELGKESRRGKIDETIFDMVPKTKSASDTDLFWLPALTKMHEKLKEAKRTLKKKDLETWILDRKAEAKQSMETLPLLSKWVQQYRIHGKDEVRRERVRKLLLKERRHQAMTHRALQEPWYDQQIWREYMAGTRGERLLNKNNEFVQAEWDSNKAAIETEIEKRRAFLQPFRDWDRKENARRNINHTGRMQIPSAIAYGGVLNLQGEICELPAAQPYLDMKCPQLADYEEDQMSDYYEDSDKFHVDREEVWMAAVPDLTRQLRDRQVEIFSDLVDKLAAKGSTPQTSAELLASIPYPPTPASQKGAEHVDATEGTSSACANVSKTETAAETKTQSQIKAEEGKESEKQAQATNDENEDEGRQTGQNAGAVEKAHADDHKKQAETFPHSDVDSLSGTYARRDPHAVRYARVAALTKDDDPQVMALRALFSVLTKAQARFACRICDRQRYQYHNPQTHSVPAIFQHQHFVTTEQNRNYDDVERGQSYSFRNKEVPSQWQSDAVEHPQYIKFAHDTAVAAVQRHNVAAVAKAEADAVATAAASVQADNSEAKGKGKGRAAGKGRKAKASSKGKGKQKASKEDDDAAGASNKVDGEAAVTEGVPTVTKGTGSEPANGDSKKAETSKPAVPVDDIPSEVVPLPEKTTDVATFDAKYRLTCSHVDCPLLVFDVTLGAHVKKLTPRVWDDMIEHIAGHYMAAQDSRETLVRASSIKVVKKPPPPPVPAYKPPIFGGHHPLYPYDSYDSEFGGSDMYDSDMMAEMMMEEEMMGIGYDF